MFAQSGLIEETMGQKKERAFSRMRRFIRRQTSQSARLRRKIKRRERARKGLSLLPSLLTLGNLVCGFGAIINVALVKYENGMLTPLGRDYLFYAGVLILLAMIFDGLDGRVARMTQSTSDFGAELDSLCDAVTFGLTPGVMVVLLNPAAQTEGTFWGRAAFIFGIAYACGAVLRLARFNTENSHEESAHQSFKGLPTPAAAGVIASLALLQHFLITERGARLAFLSESSRISLAGGINFSMPLVALGLGYLMISRHPYVHVANVYFRGRFRYENLNSLLVPVVLLCLVLAYLPELLAVLIFGGFALSGPFVSLKKMIRGEVSKTEASDSEAGHSHEQEAEDDEPDTSSETQDLTTELAEAKDAGELSENKDAA